MTAATTPSPDRPALRTRLRRVRPVPLLTLAAVWVLLWGSWGLGDVVNGLLLGALLLLLLPLPEVAFGGRLHLRSLLVLVGRFVVDLVVASAQVAWQAVGPGPQPLASVVAVRLRSSSELLMTLTVEALCLVPGSIVMEVDVRSRTLYTHVLDAPDEAAVERFRQRALAQEARIIRALGRPEDLALLPEGERVR